MSAHQRGVRFGVAAVLVETSDGEVLEVPADVVAFWDVDAAGWDAVAREGAEMAVEFFGAATARRMGREAAQLLRAAAVAYAARAGESVVVGISDASVSAH